MSQTDPRRAVPRTDTLLASPPLAAAAQRLGRPWVRAAVTAAQDRARRGEIAPDEVAEAALRALPARASSLSSVLNATGVVVHTNLGRAPLSDAAVDAVVDAAGYVDVELDLDTGLRGRRGAGVLAALGEAVPSAGGALVVNNGAAALLLATTTLAAGREVVVSRGELVEIGDGFRLPDLIASTGARLREVGTTNRTHLRDYTDAVGPETGCVLKVHPSNFRVDGFVSSVGVESLRDLRRPDGSHVPLVADIGSGLLAPDPALPDEPDASTVLRAGATIVTASGDKLLGGPQAGLILGDADVVERLRRHPLARALRVDKLTLAALEATVRGPATPVHDALHASADSLRARAERLAVALGREVVAVSGRVGGGGAPGVPLPGWAVEIPVAAVERLRRPAGRLPVVLARVDDGQGLVDVRCIPPSRDGDLRKALEAALGGDELPSQTP
ncbi:L-seryl-tRNA(Sec) selenium transferase [Ornithinimicrobium tianjinense]|uniref:L-seryl-tRNA(Sec) selenium transferase n=1 Tax=Ornithinimicrobium tianjinense TaxID=1195761 RepID=A0A917BXG0_9MICO|nr:L-seryl-tRNA(Sec) selenium transferase [Ornithinimicrobium tianjinense]GGF60025.1 L-seryl-tRNA(Sec) selenium transferase [Ornithinimicrobium tianjinense]